MPSPAADPEYVFLRKVKMSCFNEYYIELRS